MMNEARPFASLTGGLLARKGGAKPAMRPRPLSTESMLDDLGWDDMGDAFEGPAAHVPSSIAALTPAPKAPRDEVSVRDEADVPEDAPPVHVQQRNLADHYSAEESVEAEVSAPAVVTKLPSRPKRAAVRADAAGRKAAFTLRLDADRHLRLRLANAVTGKSSQQLVTAALDAFLESLPEVGTLARQVPARAGTGS